MKIKHIFSIAFAALLGGALVTSCDDIKENERYLAIEGTSTPEEPSTPEDPSTPDDHTIKPVPHVVLLEEFTGQKCLNCPVAHSTIDNLVEAYGDQFIPVSIHFETSGDAFSYPMTNPLSLATPDGNFYASKWNWSTLPCGAVDMTTLTDNGVWPSQVRSLVKETSVADIQLHAEYSNGKVDVTATVSAAEAVNGKIFLWLCESGVIAPQLQPNGETVWDYTHNHILRAAIGNREGQAVNVARQTVTDFSASLDITDKLFVEGQNPFGWKPENMTVVAFILRDQWTNVIQAAHTELIPD